MKQIFILLCLWAISNTSFAGITSAISGNWSNTTTWGGIVPGSGDDVVIAGGTNVTIDVYASCKSLTINNTAVLQFADVTTYYVLAVSGDVKVYGTLLAAATTSNAGSDGIYISGSLGISGTYTDAVTGRYIFTEMKGAGKDIDASNIDFKGNLYIDVPGGSITVDNPFFISGKLTLCDGTLDNSTHNITINSNASIDRRNSTALLAVAPTFIGTNQILDYYGTMTAGVELPDNVYQIYVSIFAGGSVTLNKNVTVSNLIGFDYSNCKLNTGANTITLTNSSPVGISQPDNTSYIVGNLARAYSGAPSSQSFPIGSASAYRPVTVNVTAITGSGTITVSQTDAAPASNSLPTLVNRISSVRYWTLTKSAGITAVTADVTLSWEADDGVSNPSEITAVHGDHSTGNWDIADNTGGYTGTASSGAVTGKGFTSFSDFTLGTTGSDNPLPVEATSFTASVAGNNVNLQWHTATETNSYGFDIERKVVSNQSSVNNSSTGNWSKVVFVEARGTTSAPMTYSFSDAVTAAGTYLYRLKQISYDGSFEYSKETEATISFSPTEYLLGQNYPNPFNPSTKISYQLPKAAIVSLKVFNTLGQFVASLVDEYKEAGYYQVHWDAATLSSGIYFCRLQAGNFVEMKKMLLVK